VLNQDRRLFAAASMSSPDVRALSIVWVSASSIIESVVASGCGDE
jgi:hypothetical protein